MKRKKFKDSFEKKHTGWLGFVTFSNKWDLKMTFTVSIYNSFLTKKPHWITETM